jgi:hypothetical protein
MLLAGVSQHCIHAIGICHASSVGVCSLVRMDHPDNASRQPTELAWQILIACIQCWDTPDDGQWTCPKHVEYHHHHHHHYLPPWSRSFYLFRHRRIAIVSWGVLISSSSRFVVEGVFRESGVVHSLKVVDPVLFVSESHVLYSRDL